MKNLKDTIQEKLVINSHQQVDEKLVINKDSKLSDNIDKKTIDEIENLALGVIDYYNQEGVYGFDEDDWKNKYNTGKEEPDFQNLIDGMILDCINNNKVKNILKKYPNTNLKEDIELAILRAGEKYMKDLSWGY